MADHLKVQKPLAQPLGPGASTPTPIASGQDGGRKVTALIKQFEAQALTPPTTTGPKSDKQSVEASKPRSVKPQAPLGMRPPVTKSHGPQTVSATGSPDKPTTASTKPASKYDYQAYVQKFGSKTANLYEIENLGVKVPERSPISSQEVLDHLLAKDKDGVIVKSWSTMQANGEVDDVHIKAITDAIEAIFDAEEFPFTDEQVKWVHETMQGKVIIARSTGDEDSADTPNAGGNESVLFVEPTLASVKAAMKEVVLSYFGADSLRNRTVGDGAAKVLEALPKMPVLLMEMIAEPIKGSGQADLGAPPPIGIAMSTNKLEFTGGEDFQFISISSAVGPGVNEGSGRVEVDETFVMQAKDGTPLLIYQQPAVKPERIRAVKGGDGAISNQLEKNSTQLAYNPSVSRAQVVSLVGSSDKIKTLNGGKTTEVEAVVGGDGQINFVQHRAIPDPRSAVAPTYVSAQQATGHAQTFQYTTVVPKSGDALVITDWNQVCFAETMKEAEAMFDWKGGSQKVVIVRQPDGSNSHPAVNFGSYKQDVNGVKTPSPIPCLVAPNYGELLAQKKTALAANQPLVIDGQSQKIFLWKDSSFDASTAIENGRISHHIGLETSVADPAIAELTDKLKTTASGKLAEHQQALTAALDTYAAKLQAYDTLLNQNADTIHNADGLKCRLKTVAENFAAVRTALTEMAQGNPQYAFDPSTHARLLLVKFFEASLHDIDGFQGLIDAERSASRYLQATKGSPIAQPVFAEEVKVVSHGLTGPLTNRWKRFLTLAEQSGLSSAQISDFKAMLADLDKMGVTATWMSTVFDQKYAEIMPPGRTGVTPVAPKAKQLLEALVHGYQSTAAFLADQKTLQKNLGEIERSLSDFAAPSKFDKAFANLKSVAKPFIEQDWPQDWNADPLKKAVQTETLGRLIEAYDGAIKTLKSSSLPNDKLIAAELEMLDTFMALFESLFTKIDLPGQNPKTKGGYLTELKQAFVKIKSQVSQLDPVALEQQFRCGADFNVTTALYSSLGKIKPSNVEEMFTTLHQGLEEIRSGLMVGGGDYGIDLPQELQSLLAAIPTLAMQTSIKRPGVLVGREITSTGVSFTYNMPVLDHGIKIRASYEKPQSPHAQGRMSIEVDYYASNEGSRLENMAKLANQFSFGGEPVDDPSRREVVWGEKQFKAKIELHNEMDVKRAVTLLNNISAFSLAQRPGAILHTNSLAYTVNKANDFTTGILPLKRRRILNDVLNVALGSVGGVVRDDGKAAQTGLDYRVSLQPSKTLSFLNPEDGQTYALDLDKPKFGLTDAVYAKIPQNVLEDAKQEVLLGSRQFAFQYQGKTYALDLNQPDLGLDSAAAKELALDAKHLGALRNELSLAWDKAAFYQQAKEPTQFRANWTDFLYGPSMAYSKRKNAPELNLWSAVSVKSTRRGDLGSIDKAFANALAKKYALHDIERRLADKGSFASPQDKLALRTSLQAYYTELSKLELACSGYVHKKLDEKKYDEVNVHGKVNDLMHQTEIQKKAIENQMLMLGMEPQGLTQKQVAALPFSGYRPK